MVELLGISPGNGRDLVGWIDVVGRAGLPGVLIREPLLAEPELDRVVRAAVARIGFVAVHLKNPHARAVAARHGTRLHAPSDGSSAAPGGSSVAERDPALPPEQVLAPPPERDLARPAERSPIRPPDRDPFGVAGAGVSAHSAAEVDRALAGGAAYVLLSPVWTPSSKPDDLRRTLGLERFLEIAAGRPVLALGGVTPDRFRALREAGAAGAAILGPLAGTPEEISSSLARYLGPR